MQSIVEINIVYEKKRITTLCNLKSIFFVFVEAKIIHLTFMTIEQSLVNNFFNIYLYQIDIFGDDVSKDKQAKHH